MLKRLASTGIACPCCGSNFDTETRVPFVGSCGDSICAACVKEKEIKTCRVCSKEGGFTCVQKNNLATKLLSVMVDIESKNSKKAKLHVEEETCDTCEPIAAILTPNNRPFLTQVINKLDPAAFTRLARTCKSLHNFCFTSKNIKIPYDIFLMSFKYWSNILHFRVVEKEYDERKNIEYRPVDYAGYRSGFLGSVIGRNKLRNYPFVLKLKELSIETNACSSFFESFDPFLAEFSILTISHVYIRRLCDWNGFARSLKGIHTKNVFVRYGDVPEGFHDDDIKLFFQNIASFQCHVRVPDRLLQNLSIPILKMYWTEISETTFEYLVMNCARSTNDIDWTFSRYRKEFEVDALFEGVFSVRLPGRRSLQTSAPLRQGRQTSLFLHSAGRRKSRSL